MSLPISAMASGVLGAGVTATAVITANSRVTTAAGPVGLVTDLVQLPGPVVTGTWAVGATRVLVGGVAVVNQASTGTAMGPSVGGPMTVALGDARVSAL